MRARGEQKARSERRLDGTPIATDRRVRRVAAGARTSDSTWPVKRLRERTGGADLRCPTVAEGRSYGAPFCAGWDARDR
jgi:hypothetical protein